MKKAANFIVSRRYWIMGAAACLTLICMLLALRVGVNYDMTKYLPDQSAMKKGMDIMTAEFPSMGADKSIRVMAEGLDEEKQAELLTKLKALPYVESVAHDGSEKYHKGDYSLFVISTSYEYGSPEERAIESALAKDFQEYRTVYRNDNPGADGVSPWLLGGAIAILVAILAAMCESWFEPLLFLINIGIAIMINEGTNLVMGQVSYVTSSIASVLQLVLSIDYSVMLMNRYRQEKARGLEKRKAMAAALCNCVSPVTGSALTTAAGLLALAFMQFKIGLDLGVALAKGVLISLLCVLTVLPGIVLLGDGMIEKTAKKTPHLSLGWLARFSYKRRYFLSVLFAVMFGAFYFLQGNTQIAYTLTKVDPIVDIFPPENILVIVYENGDEEQMAALSDALEKHPDVTQVMGYPSIFGKAYAASELADALEGLAGGMGVDAGAAGISFDPSLLNTVYSLYFAGSGTPAEEQKLTILQLFDYVHDKLLKNPLLSGMIPAEMRETVAGAKEQLEDGVRMLKSDRYSRMIVYTYLPVESAETEALLNTIEDAGKELTGEYYLIGNSAMSREMQGSFGDELRTITLLTAAAIFLIVLFTARSFIIPALLVLIVQCGVYITVTAVGWQGYSIYFLALLVVECILMGATIDYGILYASYYRENRKTRGVAEALKAAYDGSVHAIMTSGLILVLVTGIIGYTYSDPTIAEICRTISTGALSAILVILFLLPGLLAALDRLVVGRKGNAHD
ncbi:MAG: MMPL family transporter [Clostridia bacterium]|nr:MMPL family transporter [Clostridia bacterium]